MIAQNPNSNVLEGVQSPKLSLRNVVAVLQVVLATRRAARNEDLEVWYTIARGL